MPAKHTPQSKRTRFSLAITGPPLPFDSFANETRGRKWNRWTRVDAARQPLHCALREGT
ncbi:MAG: hypothetical protein AB1705_22825 [Verrucomicrobiota bacterium]